MEKEKIKKIIVTLTILGESAVGKTCICYSFSKFAFSRIYLGEKRYDFYSKMIMSDGNKVSIKLLDTGGQERYRNMELQKLRNSKGVILVFSVIDRSTFEKLDLWLKEIKCNSEDMPVVLFESKCDLEEREVSYDEAKQFADKNGILYFETSAKNNTGIKEGIETICEIVYKKIQNEIIHNRERKRKRKNKCEIY